MAEHGRSLRVDPRSQRNCQTEGYGGTLRIEDPPQGPGLRHGPAGHQGCEPAGAAVRGVLRLL